MIQRMNDEQENRLDRVLSSLAAVGAFLFFFATVTVGWYQAFRVIGG